MNLVGKLLLGVTFGLQYGLLAIGLVLVYRASRFVNFAHGQMGILAALVLGRLSLEAHVPYPIGFVVALAFGGLTGVAIDRLVVQRLFNASRLVLLVATIGVAQFLFFFTAWSRSPFVINDRTLGMHGYPVPFHFRWTVGKVSLTSSQVVTLLLAPAIAAALYLFFARTQLGKAIRAASSNPEAARLAGISVRQVSLMVWTVAGVLSALTAILQAPSTPTIDIANLGPSLLLRGLAAALIAGMSDFRVAFGAGVAIGVVEQAAFFNIHVPGVTDLTILAAVLMGILLRGKTLARSARRGDDLLGTQHSRRPLSERLSRVHVARRIGRYGWAALAVVALLLPRLPGLGTQEKATNLTFIVAFAIAGLSLTLLTGWAGQASLGHFALLGVGAYAAARVNHHHWGIPAILIFAGLVTAVVTVIIGLPAVRLRGLFLAVTTLAFATVAPNWLFRLGWVGQISTGNATLLDPRLPGIGTVHSEKALYYLSLVVLALCVYGLHELRKSNVGRALIAVRDNEQAAAGHGLTPTAVKLIALALSGFLAGVAGGLWGMAQHNWSFQAFEPTMSLTMLALAIVGGLGTLEGPIIGSLVVFGWPYLLPHQNTAPVRAISSGVLLLLVLLFIPGGVASVIARWRERLLGWIERGLPERPFGAIDGAPPLVATGVSVSFGGLRALDGVDIEVGSGEIVGLIGGNGAGKSTLMHCISGHIECGGGRITLYGQDVTRLAPEYRPYLTVARTFQDAFLYPGLTVLETVQVALDRRYRNGSISALVGAPWVRATERRTRDEALRVLERVGLGDRAGTLVSELSTGMRRLCDLATVMASEPGLVLLDEPTAGIAQREVEAFAPLLRGLRDELGCSVLIVEHDMPLLMSLCDRIYCLEAGQVIAHGAPDAVRADPRVIASYLGTEAEVIDRSGVSARLAARRSR